MLPRSNGPPRGRVGSRRSKPRLVALMRVVAVVGVLIACIHAGVWAVSRDVSQRPGLQRPARQRLLHAVRRLRPSRQRPAVDRRANPRRPEGHRALHPDGPHLFVDRRRRARAGGRRRVRPARLGRRLDRQEHRAQRARNAHGDRSRPQAPQHRQHRGRQRNDLSAASRRSTS